MTGSADAMACILVAAISLHADPPNKPFPHNSSLLSRETAHEIIDVLKEEIHERHHPTRHYEPSTLPRSQSAQPGGRNALAVLALLEAGTPAQDPRIAAAISLMLQSPVQGTYAISTRLMALSRLSEAHIKPAARDIRILLDSFDFQAGGWDYGPRPRTQMVDHSLTQFATLALSEIKDRNFRIPQELFRRIRERFLGTQKPDGGWGYRIGEPARGSMTAAGLATLALCNRHAPPGKQASARCAEAFNRAIHWLEQHFTAEANPGSRRWTDYWLLSMERAGRATGIHTLAGHSWMHEGAASIARRLLARNPDGSWRTRRGTPAGIEKISFALMFMQAATKPLAIGMIRESGESIDPIGLAPVAESISRQLEEPVRWARLSAADNWATWSRCPVLVLKQLPSSEQTGGEILLNRITRFAQNGGTIILMSGDANSVQRKAFEDFARSLLPEAKWKKLPENDPRRKHLFLRRMNIRTLGTSTREWMVNIPLSGILDDLSGNPRAAKLAIEAISTFWRSATGGVPWPRLPTSRELPQFHSEDRESCIIAEIRHDGDWNPEPMAIESTARMLGNQKRKVIAQTVHINSMDALPTGSIAWIRGHDAMQAEAIDAALLVKHLDRGGKLFIDETGQRKQFATTLAQRIRSERKGVMLGVAMVPEAMAMHTNGRLELIATSRECSRAMISHGLLDDQHHLARQKVLKLIELLISESENAQP